MDTSCQMSVPANTVSLLKKKNKGGIHGLIKELKSDHGITAKYETKGNVLTLHGDDNDILNLAVDMLEVRVGVSSKNDNKELGGNCTVKWTFTNRDAVHIKRLFGAETNKWTVEYEVTLSYGDSKVRNAIETVVITCPYQSYADFDSEIDKFEKRLKKCVVIVKPLSGTEENQHAKQFAEEENDTYYCEYEKDELILWGKNQQNCDNALAEWRKVLDQLKQTKGAEAGEQTMSGTANGNVTQHTPIKVDEGLDDEKNDSDNESIGRHSPHEQITQETQGDLIKRNATDIDKRDAGKKSGSGKSTKYSFNVNGLNVYVYNTSIVDMKDMDAVTNAANDRMAHGGGVAYFISKAAGTKMDDDCKDYIKRNLKLSVTENYISIPGKLKCKGIIHAVGPIWGDYRDKTECAQDLYSTIWKVLEATKSRSWRKVAIPAISSGIFGVPKQLCVEMYTKAFVEYGQTYGDVVEVHFVDVNQEILDLVIKAHTSWANKASTLEFDNALTYDNTQGLRQRQGVRGNRERSPEKQALQFDGMGQTAYGERMYRYRVGDKLNLRVYCGDFTKLTSVNAVAVPVTNAGGGLINIFKQMYLKKYSTFIDKNCKKAKEGSVHVFETSKGLPDIANIVLTSLEHNRVDMKLLSIALKNLFRYKYKQNVVSLAVPLIGLGHIDARNQSFADSLCECFIDSIVDVASEKLYLREIHLVNIERDATDRIQKILKQRTLSTAGNDMTSSETQPEQMYAQQQKYQQYPVEWIKHKPVDVALDKMASTKAPVVPHGATCMTHAQKEAVASLDCGTHHICKVCQPNYSDGKCLTCKTASLKNSKGSTTSICPICQDVPQQPKRTPCNHIMCSACYDNMMKHKPQCPICGHIVGIITGTQPPGDMFYIFDKHYNLPGYEKEKCGTIVIYYKFPDGKQQSVHPQPGKPYKGIERNAFLPNNKEGNEILLLLRIAFDRKLIFTIGDSTTTGMKGVITWNDIHHKTKPDGGQQSFGYPDPTYLQRVREELTDKGVKLPGAPSNKLYPDLSNMK